MKAGAEENALLNSKVNLKKNSLQPLNIHFVVMPPKNPSSETHMYACTYLQEREQYLPKNDPQASVFIRWSIDCIKHNIWVPLVLMIQRV